MLPVPKLRKTISCFLATALVKTADNIFHVNDSVSVSDISAIIQEIKCVEFAVVCGSIRLNEILRKAAEDSLGGSFASLPEELIRNLARRLHKRPLVSISSLALWAILSGFTGKITVDKCGYAAPNYLIASLASLQSGLTEIRFDGSIFAMNDLFLQTLADSSASRTLKIIAVRYATALSESSHLTDESAIHWSKFVSLESCELHTINTTLVTFNAILSLPKLHSVTFECHAVGCYEILLAVVSKKASMVRIKLIGAWDCEEMFSVLESWEGSNSLQYLVYGDKDDLGTDETTLRRLAKCCPNLRYMRFDSNESLLDPTLFPRLTKLEQFTGAEDYTDSFSVSRLAAKFSFLESLTLYNANCFRDLKFDIFPGLKALYVDTDEIDDPTAISFPPTLEKLLIKSPKVDVELLIPLLQSLPKLRQLLLRGFPAVTSDQLSRILKAAPSLTYFRIPKAEPNGLVISHPKLRIMYHNHADHLLGVLPHLKVVPWGAAVTKDAWLPGLTRLNAAALVHRQEGILASLTHPDALQVIRLHTSRYFTDMEQLGRVSKLIGLDFHCENLHDPALAKSIANTTRLSQFVATIANDYDNQNSEISFLKGRWLTRLVLHGPFSENWVLNSPVLRGAEFPWLSHLSLKVNTPPLGGIVFEGLPNLETVAVSSSAEAKKSPAVVVFKDCPMLLVVKISQVYSFELTLSHLPRLQTLKFSSVVSSELQINVDPSSCQLKFLNIGGGVFAVDALVQKLTGLFPGLSVTLPEEDEDEGLE